MQRAPLSSSQKTEVLGRQAFKCNQCQTDLEPIGMAPAHFDYTGQMSSKGTTAGIIALCPNCHASKSSPDAAGVSAAKKRRQRESEPTRKGKRFVKSGFDNKKF